MQKTICLLPGDGIGPEIVAEAVKVLRAVEKKFGHSFTMTEALLGGAAIDAVGVPLPDATVEACKATLVERSASARTRNGQLWVVTLWGCVGSLISATPIFPLESSGKSSRPRPAGFGRWCWRRGWRRRV